MRLDVAIALIAFAAASGIATSYHLPGRSDTPQLTDAQMFELMKITLENMND